MPSCYTDGQSVSNIGFSIGLIRTDDVLPTTYIGERKSNLVLETAIGVNNKEAVQIDNDPIWEFGPDILEIVLFSKPDAIPTKPEGSDFDSDGLDNARGTQLDFKIYEPLPTCLMLKLILKMSYNFQNFLIEDWAIRIILKILAIYKLERSFLPKMLLR